MTWSIRATTPGSMFIEMKGCYAVTQSCVVAKGSAKKRKRNYNQMPLIKTYNALRRQVPALRRFVSGLLIGYILKNKMAQPAY